VAHVARADYSLINYFFFQRTEPLRLCALDLPGGHLNGGFGEVDDHYLPRDKAGIQVGPPMPLALMYTHNSEHEFSRKMLCFWAMAALSSDLLVA
jgi:hypothetical protein